MVMTTSEALTASTVRIFGCSAAMSMPTSTMAATAAGFTWWAGSEPAERTSTVPFDEVGQEGGGHLGSAGVVDATNRTEGRSATAGFLR